MITLLLAEVRVVKFLKVEGYPLRIYHTNQTEIDIINSYPKTEMLVFHNNNDYACYEQIPPLNKVLKLTQDTFTLTSVKVDNDKRDPAGLAKQYGVTRIPTIILKNGEQECRIDPNEEKSWEQDIIPCLERIHHASNKKDHGSDL